MLTKVSHGILPVSPAAATENPKIDSLTQKMLDMANPDLEKAFVDSLFFPEYERREKALSRPSPKTFEWIFDRDGVTNTTSWRQVRWPSFPQWLENADSSQQ
jgi:hypothetical protein